MDLSNYKRTYKKKKEEEKKKKRSLPFSSPLHLSSRWPRSHELVWQPNMLYPLWQELLLLIKRSFDFQQCQAWSVAARYRIAGVLCHHANRRKEKHDGGGILLDTCPSMKRLHLALRPTLLSHSACQSPQQRALQAPQDEPQGFLVRRWDP